MFDLIYGGVRRRFLGLLVRVPAEIRLVDIREEIVQQLGANTDELVPKDYVFLRSVGRSLTTVTHISCIVID